MNSQDGCRVNFGIDDDIYICFDCGGPPLCMLWLFPVSFNSCLDQKLRNSWLTRPSAGRCCKYTIWLQKASLFVDDHYNYSCIVIYWNWNWIFFLLPNILGYCRSSSISVWFILVPANYCFMTSFSCGSRVIVKLAAEYAKIVDSK